MRSLWISAGALGLVTALGCGGLVPDFTDLESQPPPSPDWVGTWTWAEDAKSATLDIGLDGSIRYESGGPNGSSQFAGPGQGWEGEIECCFGLKSFTVDAPPTEGEDGVWTMQLDGRTYVRGEREFEPVPKEIEELLAPPSDDPKDGPI